MLKVLSNNLSNILEFVFTKTTATQPKKEKTNFLKYLLDFDKGFIDNNQIWHGLDLKELCKTYDDINVSIKLLEKCHGLQILFIIWQMFSCTVFGVALVACKQAKDPILVVIKCVLPFIWCFMACYVDDQLHKEVESIDTVIIKHIIDYRCDRPKRNILQNFKLLFLRALEGAFSRWSPLHLQSLAPTNPHWALVVGHGPWPNRPNPSTGKPFEPAVETLIGCEEDFSDDIINFLALTSYCFVILAGICKKLDAAADTGGTLNTHIGDLGS
ncbi:hypothetical protein evm_011398 [Chilo suppressalis]|nr:hypothetical protein evm_011398 [Chilo suppressalis]